MRKMRKRTTFAAVNAALRAAGHAEKLVRGRGYFYFTDGESGTWVMTGVYGVCYLDDLSVAAWLRERDLLATQGIR